MWDFGENGIQKVTNEEMMDYFEKNYCIVDHIYINVGTQTKSDGTSVALTDDEITEQRQLAESIYNRVMAGEDFLELKKQYSQDAYGLSMYPHGFHVTKDYSFTKEFQDACFEMSVGEIRMVESKSNGKVIGIHIMKKYETDGEKYNTYDEIANSIIKVLSAEKFNNLLDEHIPNVKENKAVTDMFDIKLISALS